MAKWKYRSLQWIHDAREQDYNETRNLSSAELITATKNSGEIIARKLGLRILDSGLPVKESSRVKAS